MEVKEVISAFEKELACRKMDSEKCVETICSNCQCYVRPAELEEAFKAAIDTLKKGRSAEARSGERRIRLRDQVLLSDLRNRMVDWKE